MLPAVKQNYLSDPDPVLDELETMPDLTLREWAIMNVCWMKSKLTVPEIIEQSPETEKKHYQTMKAQIEGLVKKGYLIRQKQGHHWVYSAKYPKRKVLIKEAKNFIETVTSTSLSETMIELIKEQSFRSTELIDIMTAIINLTIGKKENPEEKEKK